MKTPFLLIVFACICPVAVSADVQPRTSTHFAHREALATLRNAVSVVRQPVSLSIDSISRQLAFNYDEGECIDTYSHANYCAYFPKSSSGALAAIRKITVGRDRRTGLLGGTMFWQGSDDRVCVSKREMATLLGSGVRPEVSSIPWIPPVPELRPPAITELEYNAIPGAAASVSARATYQNRCLIDLTLYF